MVYRNVYRITIDICIPQLGRVEEIIWLPYDAGLLAALETLVGIPPFTPAFLKSTSSRGLFAIAELLVNLCAVHESAK